MVFFRLSPRSPVPMTIPATKEPITVESKEGRKSNHRRINPDVGPKLPARSLSANGRLSYNAIACL